MVMEEVLEQWESVNLTLNEVVTKLRQSSSRNPDVETLIHPAQPISYLVRLRDHTWPADQREAAAREVHWALRSFYPYLAYVSYTIATFPGYDETPPSWITRLYECDMSSTMVDKVLHSEVAMFEPRVQRMGALLDIESDRWNYIHYVRCNVPAWFEFNAVTSLPARKYNRGDSRYDWVLPTDREVAEVCSSTT